MANSETPRDIEHPVRGDIFVKPRQTIVQASAEAPLAGGDLLMGLVAIATLHSRLRPQDDQ